MTVEGNSTPQIYQGAVPSVHSLAGIEFLLTAISAWRHMHPYGYAAREKTLLSFGAPDIPRQPIQGGCVELSTSTHIFPPSGYACLGTC